MNTIQEYIKTKPELTRTVVCYLIKDNSVLLGLRKQTEWGLGHHLISGIGGRVGDHVAFADETEAEALVREVKEEIEVDITTYHAVGNITFLFKNKQKWNQHVNAYLVDTWYGLPLETDFIQPLWFEINKLPFSQMWDDAQYWIPLILDKKYVNAVFLYGEDNKTVIDKDIKVIGN